MQKGTMHFSKIMWELAKNGDAFLLNADRETMALVPFGKYAGLWRYSKGTKRLHWTVHTENLDFPFNIKCKEVLTRKNKLVKFPLPEFVYHTYAGRHPGRIHRAHRKTLGYASFNWKKFVQTKTDPLKEILELVQEKLDYKSDMCLRRGIALAFMFAMPQFLNLVQESPELAAERARHIFSYSQLFNVMGPAQRQRFIVRLVKEGLKPALVKTFRKTPIETIELVASDHNITSANNYVIAGAAIMRSDWGSKNLSDFNEIKLVLPWLGGPKVKRIKVCDWIQV